MNIFLAISYVLKSVFLGQIEQIREKNEVDVASDIDKTNDLIMKFSTNTLRFLMVLIIVLFSVDKSSAQSVCEECTISNPAVDQNSILTINADEVVCFTESRTIGGLDIKGGTICISEGATLTVNNNVNSYNGSTLELEIYGTLQFNQVTTLNSTVIINIYNSGELRSGTSGSNDFSFNGSGISYINNDGKLNIGTLTFSNSSGEYIFDNYGVIDVSSNINIDAKLTKFKNNFEGTMSIGASFNMNEGTEFYNCGEITTASGFNMGGGNVVNTNSFTANGNVNYGNGTSRFDNFGTLNINNGDIQMANNTYFYNEGVAIFSGGSFANDGHILGPEEGSGKLGYIYFDKAVTMNNGSIGPNLNFKNTNGTSSFAVMFNDRPNINIEDGVSWDCESSGTCAAEKQIVLDLCPDFDGNFPDPEVPLNTTNAVDDFYETGKNTSISGNVLDNDFDLEDDTQTVSTTGTFTTDKGGSVAINANGTFTYTPPAGGLSVFDSFKYTVCDDGAPKACDEADVVIAVGICSEAVEGEPFKWSNTTPNGAVESGNTLSKTITQPAANYGFVFDIIELDNSFNMEINGVKLAVHEIEFQSSDTPGPINIRFADGDKYEANTQDIWQMRGTADRPLIRVKISPAGKVSMYGSKLSGGKLYPLVLFNGNSFNVVPMYVGDGEENVITVTQNMVGVTKIEGTGYGANQIDCPNYWYGYDGSNEWADIENWTDNYVPENLQDIEFATEDNNSGAILGLSGKAAGLGVAKEDLHLDDAGRIIRDLINKSDKNLVVTLDNLLIVDGKVREDNTGGVVVQADPNDVKAMGSLKFNNPGNNQNVAATVQFHNKACECADCGFYRKQWQYFGVPVKSATFPYMDVDGEETINMYVEPHNGDKWRPVSGELNAFKGYQINNNLDAAPQDVYNFAGTLFVGDATVALTKTENVNYSGTNLVSNSYTAAIPISADAITFPTDAESTVYLFNTGTRDQWRKLNGTAISQDGYRSGQYLVVPVNLGGTLHFPDRIPSMHSFMVLVESGTGGNLTIDYSKLVKNTTVALGDGSTQIVTRSANATSDNESTSASSIPSLVMDVIGEESADRVWIFAKEGTTHGFDNGWDGRKMTEGGIAQLYVTGSDNSKLQVATVPTFESIMLGFEADVDGKYTIEFALSDHWTTEELYLRDLATGTSERVAKGGSYTFQAKKGDSGTRFSLSASGTPGEDESAKIVVQATDEGKIAISNNSNRNCTISISNTAGKLLQSLEVKAGDGDEVESLPKGSYVVRIQNAVVSDARKVIVD